MALDLTLQITADASQAKAALRDVEQGIKQVDSTAQKSTQNHATWWQKEEQSIKGVTEALKPHKTEVSKIEAAYAKAEAAVANAEKTSAKLGSTSVQTTAALGGLRTEGTALTSGLGALTTAGGLSAGMLTAITGGAILAASAIGALLGFIADASIEYFKHGEAMAGARKELDDLTDSWTQWKLVIGEAALGDQAPIIGTLRLMETVLGEVAVRLATNIALAREFAGWWIKFSTGVDLSPIGKPDPTKPDPRWDKSGGRRRDFGDFGQVDPDLTKWDNKAYAEEQKKLAAEAVKALREAQEIWKSMPPGMLQPGNIDLLHRPRVWNEEEGGYSTVWSMSIEEDNKQILIPRISLLGKILSEEQAIDEYHRTHRQLGVFGSVEDAERYADALHKQQEALYADGRAAAPAGMRKYILTDKEMAVETRAIDALNKIAAKAYDTYMDMEWANAVAEAQWEKKYAGREAFAEQGSAEWEYEAGDFTRTDSGRDPGIGGVVSRGPQDWTPKGPSSYGERLTGLLSQDLVATLQGYLTARSSKGGAIGGAVGGDIGKAFMTEDFKEKLSDKFGGVGGGIIGAAIPFLGTLVGSLVGKLFGKIFGQTQGQKDLAAGNKAIEDMKKGLSAQYGSEAAAKNASNIFGGDLTAAWSSQNLAGAERFKQLQAELAAKQAAFNSSLGGTLSKIKDLGGSIPEALRPYLSALEDAKVLTQDNLDLIASMAQDAVPTWEQMADAAGRLGISTDSLGQSFQNAKAAANWQSVIDDLDTLIRGGADMNALLGDTGLQKKFNDLVQQSIKFGTAIPENMKPWIQKMIEAGTLLDASGTKITDISQLKFGETMQTTLENLNTTLRELIEALSIKLPQAAREGVDGWNREWDRAQRPDPTGPRKEGPDSDYSAPSSRAARGGGGTAIIQLEGRTIAKVLVPHFPGAVKTYGTR